MKLLSVLTILVYLVSFQLLAVTVRWNAPISSQAVTKTRIYYGLSGTTLTSFVDVNVPAVSHVIDNALFTNGRDYSFELTHWNQIGESPRSATVTKLIVTALPSAPTGITVEIP